MAAPSTTISIRTDVAASIAMNHAVQVVRDLHDAMWWEEAANLVNAESNAKRALEYIQAARKNFATRARA